MKHLKKIFENSKELEVEKEFEKAYQKGVSYPNIYYYNTYFDKFSEKYNLYDNYYLYNDSILCLNRIGDYDWELRKIKDEPHIFKEKIFNKIKKLENAFNKL